MPEWFETWLWIVAAFVTAAGAIFVVALLALIVCDGNAPMIVRRWWDGR